MFGTNIMLWLELLLFISVYIGNQIIECLIFQRSIEGCIKYESICHTFRIVNSLLKIELGFLRMEANLYILVSVFIKQVYIGF